MLLLLSKILLICTSLFAWAILSVAGFTFSKYVRYDKGHILTIYILCTLWIISSFHGWYEGFFLFRNMSLVASLDSWIFTLLTPLFYFYFCFRITGSLPDRLQWMRQLFFPTVLALVYAGMLFFNPVSDKLIYSWYEFELNATAWWINFRIACYLVLLIQFSVYLFLFLRINRKWPIQNMRLIKKELQYTGCFYLISLSSVFTSFYICDILYHLFCALMAAYIWKQSAFYRIIKQKTGRFILPYWVHMSDLESGTKGYTPILLSRKEEERLKMLLKSPDFLHNPNLTIKMVAREFGTNPTTLSHYFNRQLQVSFTEYVTALRLDEAEVLLKETDIKVIEISELAGFQTSSTFYQAFNNRHHQPPSQWRKNKTDYR